MWHEVLLALSGYSGDIFIDAPVGYAPAFVLA
jgi:hypothetical protein